EWGIRSSYVSSWNTLIENNNISGNGIGGIYLDHEHDLVCRNNTINHNGEHGIYGALTCYGGLIQDNICSLNGLDGIHLRSSMYDVTACNNTCVSNGRSGIFLNSTWNNPLIVGNNCSNNLQHGIYTRAGGGTIQDNLISNNSVDGIFCYHGDVGTGNWVISNTVGIQVEGGSYGIHSNYLLDNDIGLKVSNLITEAIWVWDNYFDNRLNLKIESSASVFFNIEPNGVTNMVGGPSQGGNYWSDYSGRDTNYDGFGDQPHHSGDRYPLMIIPMFKGIEDLTDSYPVTGEEMEITFRVHHEYRWILSRYQIDYLFTLTGSNNTYRDRYGPYEFWDLSDPTVPCLIPVPENATYLHYVIKVDDRYGQMISINGSLRVVDGISPQVTKFIVPTLGTGATETIWIMYRENIGLNSSYLILRSDGGIGKPEGTYLPVQITENELAFNVTIPEDAKRVNFEVHMLDDSGQYSKNLSRWYFVEDIMDPKVELLTNLSRMKTYEEETIRFRIIDNIGIAFSRATVELLEGTRSIEGYHTYEGDDIHGFIFKLPLFTEHAILVLEAEDAMSNRIELFWTIALQPEASDIVLERYQGDPETGQPYEIDIPLMEGAGYREVLLSWSFDIPGYFNSIKHNRSGMFIVPEEARVMHYELQVFDVFDRMDKVQFSRQVIDVIPPEMFLEAGGPRNGMLWEFHLDVRDNREIGSYSISLHDGEDALEIEEVSPMLFQVEIPDGSDRIGVRMSSVDSSGNLFDPGVLFFDVIDVILPVFIDVNAEIFNNTEEQYLLIECLVHDNRDLWDVSAMITLPSGDAVRSPMIWRSVGLYEINISVGFGPGNVSFLITAEDHYGNIARWSSPLVPLPDKTESHSNGTEEKDGGGHIKWIPFISIILAVIIIAIVLLNLRKRGYRHLSEE
ncbi:MAG: nitrous oxide reductase family maturation protein NosD, partial [Thermoplasmatota archaeon]